MSDACHEMNEGEVLNADHREYSLYHAVLYGSKLECVKLSKRLSCAIKHLPLRVTFSFEYNTQKAVDSGVQKDPTLFINGKIFIEGLVQAEIITQKFKKLLEKE
jgi:hypothetical protein